MVALKFLSIMIQIIIVIIFIIIIITGQWSHRAG